MSFDLCLEIVYRTERHPVMPEASGLAADEMIGRRDEVFEWKYSGEVQPGSGRRRDRNAVDGAYVRVHKDHSVPSNSPALWPKSTVRPSEVDQEVVLRIPRQGASPQHGRGFAAAHRPAAHGCEEPGGVHGVLFLAPRNSDSPAGNAEIAVPCTMVRQACSLLFGKRE
ncbi:hypothetical protein D3C73_1178380 [compost metagenome]